MRLFKVEITQSHLKMIPESERVFLFQIGNVLNDINMLQRCVIFSSNGTKSSNQTERTSQVSLALFFIRILAGKLEEAWQMLQNDFFGGRLSVDFEPQLSPAAKESLSKVKSYFGRSNIIHHIRNEFAFHYGSEEVTKELDKMGSEDVLEMFLSEGRGNCLFSGSSTVIASAVLNQMDSPDSQNAMNTLFDEVAINVSGWFQEFAHDCLTIIARKCGLTDYTEVHIPDPPADDEVVLPFFIRPPESG